MMHSLWAKEIKNKTTNKYNMGYAYAVCDKKREGLLVSGKKKRKRKKIPFLLHSLGFVPTLVQK